MADERPSRRANGTPNVGGFGAAGSNNPRTRAQAANRERRAGQERSSHPAQTPRSGQTLRAGQAVRPAQTSGAGRAVLPAQSGRSMQVPRGAQPMRLTGSGQPVQPAQPVRPVRPVRPAQSASHIHAAQASRSTQPQKPEKAKRKGPWSVVFWLALVVFVVSLGALAYIGYTYWQGQKAYDDIAGDAFVAPDSTSLADFQVDWDALRAINSDVVGWIYMPGTGINYPIAWREGDDDYYLKHNFNGVTSAQFGAEYGCIMLSGVNQPDFSDTVNIIYGHNMANGTMFAPLAKYYNVDEFNAHRLVYLLTPKGNYLLQTYSIVRVPGSSTDIVIPNFTSDEDRVDYMQDKIDTSLVTPDPEGSAAKDIAQTFALVTCDGADRSYRYITYCEILDYYPMATGAGATGSSAGSGAVGAGSGSGSDGNLNDGGLVSRNDLSNVGNAASDRAA